MARVKFEEDCVAKVMLIYKETHEKVALMKQEKNEFIATGTLQRFISAGRAPCCLHPSTFQSLGVGFGI